MRNRNEKGFTLMVVLAILGLLAGIGVPQYTKVMERARIGRDVAAIATVQTAVNAFLTETQWRPTGEVPLDLENTKADSLLTGAEVKLKEFLDEGFPTLESEFVSNGVWYIDKDGKVFVRNGESRLPGDDQSGQGD